MKNNSKCHKIYVFILGMNKEEEVDDSEPVVLLMEESSEETPSTGSSDDEEQSLTEISSPKPVPRLPAIRLSELETKSYQEVIRTKKPKSKHQNEQKSPKEPIDDDDENKKLARGPSVAVLKNFFTEISQKGDQLRANVNIKNTKSKTMEKKRKSIQTEDLNYFKAKLSPRFSPRVPKFPISPRSPRDQGKQESKIKFSISPEKNNSEQKITQKQKENIKKLLEIKKEDGEEKQEEIQLRPSLREYRSTSLKAFVCANPKAFMKLVDEENKRASVRNSSEMNQQFTLDGVPEDQRQTLIDLHKIQTGESLLEIPLTPHERFKSRYSIVKKSDLDPAAKEEEEKLKLSSKSFVSQVFDELIETERSYIERLNVVIEIFLEPIRERQLLNSFEIVSLFSNIETLISKNEDLLSDLETALELMEKDDSLVPLYSQWVGEIFTFHSPILQPVYASYCTNQPTIDSSLRQFKTNSKFASFLRSAMRKPKCQKQDLNSFLISPLQRLCKYPLLLREMIKYTTPISPERGALEIGYQAVLTCVENVNQKVKQVENITKLTEIAMELTNGAKFRDLIVDPSKSFIMKEYMIVNDEIRYIYLFSHLILICKQTPQNLKLSRSSKIIEHLIVHCLILNFVELENSPDSETNFTIECNDSTYICKCKNNTQKKIWVNQIKKLIEKAESLELSVHDKRRSRMISLENNTKDRRKPRFLKVASNAKKNEAELGKLQKNLRNEQLRRKIEQDNTFTYKSMYEELKLRYETETNEYKQKIKNLETTVKNLETKLSNGSTTSKSNLTPAEYESKIAQLENTLQQTERKLKRYSAASFLASAVVTSTQPTE